MKILPIRAVLNDLDMEEMARKHFGSSASSLHFPRNDRVSREKRAIDFQLIFLSTNRSTNN